MPKVTLDDIEKQLDAGVIPEAMAGAAALLDNAESRAEGIWLLGRCYLEKGSIPTARYLFSEAVEEFDDPRFRRSLKAAKAQAHELGLFENFKDAGHRCCDHCNLYYRAEHTLCPYCQQSRAAETASTHFERELVEDELRDWDESPLDKLDRISQDAIDKAREIADSDSVKELAERTKALGKEAVEKAKVFTEKEQVKEITERAKGLGHEASEKLKTLSEKESVRGVLDNARETGTRLLDDLKQYIQNDRDLYTRTTDEGRRNIIIKWIAIVAGIVLALRIILWIL